MLLDEQERQQEERRTESGIEQDGQNIGAGKVPISEQIQRHHRFLHSCFGPDEQHADRNGSSNRQRAVCAMAFSQ
jgi:hypothetical protein